MKNMQLLLIIGMITIHSGCKKNSPTQPIDQNPTKIVLLQVNDTKFQGLIGSVVTHVGDSVTYNIIATDKDKLASYTLTWSNTSSRINSAAAPPLSDTMAVTSRFLIDSTSYPFNTGYQPGSTVIHYITFNDALGFQTQVEVQCIVSK